MNCIIIDDEPLAIKVIEKHLSIMDGYHVIATFESALRVYKFLQENKVDLVFLDIEMPNLSGLNFLKLLHEQPQVIVTTAHREYALESYDYVIADYLLKPISFDRLLRAISKLDKINIQSNKPQTIFQPSNVEKSLEFTYFKVDRRNMRIYFTDILYIESVKNHVKLVLSNGAHLTHLNLQEVESKLNADLFIRIHKSYIIGLNHVESYNNSHIEVNKQQIPIGRSYKVKVLETLNRNLF